MRLRNLLLPIIAALAMLGTAHAADPYLIVGGSLANISDLDTDNIGYSGEGGLLFGNFAVGIEASNHMHLGNSTLAGAVNGRVFTPEWHSLKLYGSGGAGATTEGNPLAQAGAGIMWIANDEGEAGSFALYAGVERRYYFESFSDFDSTGNDGVAKVGLMLTF